MKTAQNVTLESVAYATLRLKSKDSPGYGSEWIDISSISFDATESRAKADAVDKIIPHWAQDNPISRTARIAIKEVKE